MMRLMSAALVLAALVALSSPRAAGVSVSELVQAVRQALADKRPDAEIVFLVGKAKLAERLDDAAIEQLQSEGAGPKTVEQLEWQREESLELPAARELRLFDVPPAPTGDEQQRLIARARAVALEYTKNLPDFLCTESVRRFVRDKSKPWKAAEAFVMDVSYSAKDGESYRLLTFDGKPTNKTLRSIGGFKSDGEFGSLLRSILKPEARAEFAWERWANLRGRRVAVFSYHVERAYSTYTVRASTNPFRTHAYTTGMRGSLYIDPESARMLRFSNGDDGLPSNSPVRSAHSVLDYDYAEISGERFLLPKRVDIRAVFREGHRFRNVMRFEDYRKFTSDASITFERQ